MAYGQTIEALADPTRRAIFERLRNGPLAVGRLAAGLDVSRPAVSQHLKVLSDAGLVRAEREGTRRIYRIEARGLDELRAYLERFWKDVLDAFRDEADRTAPKPKARAKTRRRHVER